MFNEVVVRGLLALSSSIFVCMGCAGHIQDEVHSIPFVNESELVVPAEIFKNKEISMIQQVDFIQDGKPFVFHAQVEIDDTRLTIAGLSTLGARIFLLSYKQQQLTLETPPLIQLPFESQYILRDFLLCFLDVVSLQKVLPEFTVSEQNNTRVITGKNQKGLTIKIVYDDLQQKSGKIHLFRSDMLYELKVDTVQYIDYANQ